MTDPNDTVEYRITKELSPESVRSLYVGAGWIPEDADGAFIEPMLRNSFAVSAAFSSGRLIGMMRALSDGVSDAYVLDLIVSSDFRRRGIAREVLNRLVAHLEKFGIDWIVCIGAPGTEEFYAKTNAAAMKEFTPLRFYGKEKKGRGPE